jgi:transcription-repair coupling factor (superfamily II helicase)
VRIEFWGDTVEEICWFKVAALSTAWRSPSTGCGRPCRELLLTAAVRERARRLAGELPGVFAGRWKWAVL